MGMAMVSTEVRTFNVEGKLIIFPAYVFYLQQHGYSVNQRNDKHSNRKLNEILMKANLAEALNESYVIPDFLIFEDGKWKAFRGQGETVVRINAGRYGTYLYYPEIWERGNGDGAILNMMQAFVMQYSSAKIQVVKR